MIPTKLTRARFISSTNKQMEASLHNTDGSVLYDGTVVQYYANEKPYPMHTSYVNSIEIDAYKIMTVITRNSVYKWQLLGDNLKEATLSVDNTELEEKIKVVENRLRETVFGVKR